MSDMLRRVIMMMQKAAAVTYATWDPANKGTGITLSGGNLVAALPAAAVLVKSTISKAAGKWYWEVTRNDSVGAPCVGIASTGDAVNARLGAGTGSYSFYLSTGAKFGPSDAYSAYGAASAAGDVIGVALDLTAGTLTFYKNNVSQGVAFSGLSGTFFAAVGVDGGASTVTANFGASAFVYSPPAGFNAGMYV